MPHDSTQANTSVLQQDVDEIADLPLRAGISPQDMAMQRQSGGI